MSGGPDGEIASPQSFPEDDEDGNGSKKGIVVATLKVLYITLKLISSQFLATEMEFGLRLGDTVWAPTVLLHLVTLTCAHRS